VAFGTSIARAEVGAGEQIERGGNELFNTALGLQRMANETAAKDTDVAYTADLAKMQSQYETTEGVNAQAGLAKHIEDVQKLRQQYVDSAKNPEQRRMLIDSIDRRTGYAITDAGRHAATQTKKANDDATDARLKSGIDFADVSNPEKFKAGINQTISETQAKGRDKGWKPEKTRAEVRDNVSSYLFNAMRKHSPIDPEQTLDVFNEVKDQMRDDQRDVLKRTIDHDIAMKGSQVEAQKILGDDPLKTIGKETELLGKAKEVADSDRFKDNPDFGRLLNYRISSAINLASAAKRDTDLRNELMLKDYVHGKDYASKISSIDGVTGPNAPPEIRDAYQALDRAHKDQIDAYIAKENKLSVPYDAPRQARFKELWGESITNPSEFAKRSLLDEDLDHGHIDQLIKKQAGILGRTVDDSHVNQYLGWSKDIADASGVHPSTTDTRAAERYTKYVGAMGVEVQQYEALHKAAPTREEVRKMSTEILKEVISGTTWMGMRNRTERQFEMDVPKDYDSYIRDDFRKRFPDRPDLTPDQVRSRYWHMKNFPNAQSR
jgi:hypothetical protein